MSNLRQRIIDNARTWLGTRFHHQGRLKKSKNSPGGVDCLGLLIGVAKELGLKNENDEFLFTFDETDYGIIPDSTKLIANLEKHFSGVQINEIKPGDVLLIEFDNNPQHLAIVSDYPESVGIIHCYRQAGMVVEHRLDNYWKGKIFLAFRLNSNN